ncbi:MAG TPA: GTP cyclohydrolase I [Ktedonobacteraceae bacterium]|nr:GTP cyclohydrolase I [Ktedonobacteraceae bacterium]
MESSAPFLNGSRPHSPQIDETRLIELGRELLLALGEDPEREGLRETPRRWAAAWREFLNYDPGQTDVTFAHSTSTGQLVCVSGIHVFSICEHHLLPFECIVAIGYIPQERVLGLSKFARIAHACAHRLQLQEQLGQHIAAEIVRIAETPSVAVVLKGVHHCMVARGIRTPGMMTTTVMQGRFETEVALRDDFWRIIREGLLLDR